MSFVHRGQQHRYLITYDDQLDEFTPGSWKAWRRVALTDGGDMEGEEVQVEVSSAEVQSVMCAKWLDSPFACKSLDALHKASQLGPARDREVPIEREEGDRAEAKGCTTRA